MRPTNTIDAQFGHALGHGFSARFGVFHLFLAAFLDANFWRVLHFLVRALVEWWLLWCGPHVHGCENSNSDFPKVVPSSLSRSETVPQSTRSCVFQEAVEVDQ